MCGMCTPPLPLGLQCIYIACIHRVLWSLWIQACSREPAIHFLLLSPSCNLIRLELFLCRLWRLGWVCVCLFLVLTQTKKTFSILTVLQAILEKREFFPTRNWCMQHTMALYEYNTYGLYGQGLQDVPVCIRLLSKTQQLWNWRRLLPACIKTKRFCRPLMNPFNQLEISKVLKRVPSWAPLEIPVNFIMLFMLSLICAFRLIFTWWKC